MLSKKYTTETFRQKLLEKSRTDLELIEEYGSNGREKILFKCTICGNEWLDSPLDILSGKKCPICTKIQIVSKRRKTNEQFLKDFAKKGDPNIEILEEYRNNINHIKVRCKINPLHEWMASPKELLRHRGCPYCKNRRIASNKENSVGKTHPELLKYFVDSKDAFENTIGSRKKFYFKCPDCGMVKSIPIPVYNLLFSNFFCEFCGNTTSKPNKFIREAVRQLLEIKEIDSYQLEYSPEWAGKFRYDCYIKKDNLNILIEMDGIQHKIDKGVYSIGIKERDKNKTQLAKENNFILIRIDCEDTSFDNLKYKLLDSNIVNFVNFDKINWENIEINMQENLMKKICNEYNKYEYISLTQLAKIFHISVKTIKKMLELGNKIGLCEYDEITHSKEGKNKKLKKPVDIYDLNNNLIMSIDTVGNAYKWIREKTGGCKINYVNECLNGKRSSYKNYIFKYHNPQTTKQK